MYASEGGSLLGKTAAPWRPTAEPLWKETFCTEVRGMRDERIPRI